MAERIDFVGAVREIATELRAEPGQSIRRVAESAALGFVSGPVALEILGTFTPIDVPQPPQYRIALAVGGAAAGFFAGTFAGVDALRVRGEERNKNAFHPVTIQELPREQLEEERTPLLPLP